METVKRIYGRENRFNFNEINKGKDFCGMKAVSEAVLEQAFVEVFNEIKLNKEEILGTVAANIEKVLKSQTDVQQIEKIDSEIEFLKEQLKSLVQMKTTEKLDTEVIALSAIVKEFSGMFISSYKEIKMLEKRTDDIVMGKKKYVEHHA